MTLTKRKRFSVPLSRTVLTVADDGAMTYKQPDPKRPNTQVVASLLPKSQPWRWAVLKLGWLLYRARILEGRHSMNLDSRHEERIAEIEAAIAAISETMKGPLPNAERFMLHEDRKDLRRELAALRGDSE